MSHAGEVVGDDELYQPREEPQEVGWGSDFEALSDADCEQFARAQGWRPLSQYRGAAGGWQDARTFLRIGQEQLPVLRNANHRMTEKLVRMEGEVNTLRRTVGDQQTVLEELRTLARTANDRGYQRALAELRTKQDEAAAAGDAAEVRRTTEQIVALETERAEAAPPAKAEPARSPGDRAPPPPPPEPPEVAAFRARNPWVGVNRYLTGLLITEDQKNVDAYPEMDITERLEMSLANVKRMAPDHFPGEAGKPTQRRPVPPARPGLGSRPPNRGGADPNKIDSIDDPDERAQARKAFERNVNMFGKGYTEEEYMQVWRDPHAPIDVITRKGK